MSSPGGRRLSLGLDGEETGTALGAIAWVMGALEIMKDRGHAEGDEQLHELYDSLIPRLEALVAKVSGARRALGEEDALQREIEDAFQPVREAFEVWIRLTASDTVSVAVDQRLGGVPGDEDGDGEGGEPPADGGPE